MMKFRKTKMVVMGLTLLAVLLAGCGSKTGNSGNSGNTNGASLPTASPEASNNVESVAKELRIAFNAQPTTLDPHKTTAWITKDVSRPIFETLVAADENYSVTPLLAESFDVSEDAKTFTFKLRQGVKFHNGKEMKAEDVVASMNRWIASTTVGAATFGDATFTEVDEYTVELVLDKPSGNALQVMINTNQYAAIMPKEIIEAAGEGLIEEYIGTGPYKFQEWKQDQYISLVRYDEYASSATEASGVAGKKEAPTETLMMEFVTDASTRIAGLKSGQYDIAVELPPDYLGQIEGDSNLASYVSFAGYNPLIMNNKMGVLSDEKIRLAIAAALDAEKIMMGAYGNKQFYRTDGGLMLPEQTDWYTEAGLENYNQNDPEKAKQLLAEAGYNGEPIKMMTSREYEDLYNSSVVVKALLEEIGMVVDLQLYDWGTVVGNQPKPEVWDMFITTFSSKTDPTQILFLDSRNQWAGWHSNPMIDELLDNIRQSTNQEDSKKWFEEIQQEFWNTVPVYKIGDKYTMTAAHKNVQGFTYFEGPVFWNAQKAE
ncbi:ABC transporter substrate-binding protein [Paenibacillus septentrionalis]|uniref:ABC transporter substrate-binding protein n=1 Tax=Paenibacillus septentrionalis TaxID=429342 RepID=A0ABW1V2C6_9BACL